MEKQIRSKSNAVLFLCTGNSCRSQMAEGFAKTLFPENIQIYSAGITPVAVNPLAMKVMSEAGVDIKIQSSKGFSAVPIDKIDALITLCDHAQAYCPTLPGPVDHRHWPIDDPVGARGSDEKVLPLFRKARDEIRDRIIQYVKELKDS